MLRILSNDLDASAEEIADLYKRRWAIELFFRWIKQTLKITRFLGTSENAVRIQIAVALIAFLLLRLAQAAQKAIHSPLAFARLVRANLMHRRRIDRLLRARSEHRSSSRLNGRSNGTETGTGQPWADPGHPRNCGASSASLPGCPAPGRASRRRGAPTPSERATGLAIFFGKTPVGGCEIDDAFDQGHHGRNKGPAEDKI